MKKFFVWIVILIIVALAVSYFARNVVVAWAIEKSGTYALGVDTHLGSANLSLGAGSLELHNYKVDNPEGYPDDGFLDINYGSLTVNAGSVFSDTVEVDSLILDGIKVRLIQNGDKGNFMEIMNHARDMDYDTSSSETMVKVHKLAVRNIAVDASLKIKNLANIDKSFTIENINLSNVGGDNGSTISKISAIIIQEILNKAVIKGKGQLSDQFGKSLKQLEKGAVEKAGEDAVNKIKDIGSSLLGGDKK